MKKFWKIIFTFSFIVGLLASGFMGWIYLNREKLIHQFIIEANKSLKSPVHIGKIEISAWRQFPNVTVSLNDVKIKDELSANDHLAVIELVSFSLNAMEIWKGKYQVKGLTCRGGELNLSTNKKGESNYMVWNNASVENNITFDLSDIKISNISIEYANHSSHQILDLLIKEYKLDIKYHQNVYEILGDGTADCERLSVDTLQLIANKALKTKVKLSYGELEKSLNFLPSEIWIGESPFTISGIIDFGDKPQVDVAVKGKETTWQTLLSLLPKPIQKPLAVYEADGDMYFEMQLKGEISETKNPSVIIQFGFSDAAFKHTEAAVGIAKAKMKGSMKLPSLSDLTKAEVVLENITGMLHQHSFKAHLTMRNFINPWIDFSFNGQVDAPTIAQWVFDQPLKEVSGTMDMEVSLIGDVEKLKKRTTAQQVKIEGNVNLNNMAVKLEGQDISIADLNGSMKFNNNDLALKGVRGRIDNSDFNLDGYFRNIVTYLLFDDQPIGIEADLTSHFMDMDRLLQVAFGAGETGDFNFFISPLVYLNFHTSIDHLKYRRFTARELKGDLIVKDQLAAARKISFKSMGGALTLNGIVDGHEAQNVLLDAGFGLENVDLDSLFYVFNNFKQNFISDQHLKGKTTSNVYLTLTLDPKLQWKPESLTADINAMIKGGELNDFEPIMKLDRYLDDEGLKHLKFDELKNEIHIENKVIYIPQMNINSNVTSLQLSGKHTFDGLIDYHIVTPLRQKTNSPSGSESATKLFLKITGTTQQYEVGLDKQEIKKKIVADLKKEVQELKDAFNKKKEKKKALELKKNDYFDWDNDGGGNNH